VSAASAVLAAGAGFPASPSGAVPASTAELAVDDASTELAPALVDGEGSTGVTFPASSLTEDVAGTESFPKSAVPVVEGEASPLVEPAGDDASTFPESTGADATTAAGWSDSVDVDATGATGATDDVSVVDSVVPDVTDGAVADTAPSVNSFPASVTSKSGSFVKSAAGASKTSPVILLLIFAMMRFPIEIG
jgi:hypothetical protein